MKQSIFSLSLAFLFAFTSCGDDDGGNPLESLDPALSVHSELRGRWFIYERTFEVDTCSLGESRGDTYVIHITEKSCEIENPKPFFTSATGCRAAGDQVIIYLEGSRTEKDCTISGDETISLALRNPSELYGSFEGSLNVQGDCSLGLTNGESSCRVSGTAAGYPLEPANPARFPSPSVDERDVDLDGIRDTEDNCPHDPNADQADDNENGIGNACEADVDRDGIGDSDDNCPRDVNADQVDLDQDGIGNLCDSDRDGDAFPNDTDPCPDESSNGCLPIVDDSDPLCELMCTGVFGGSCPPQCEGRYRTPTDLY